MENIVKDYQGFKRDTDLAVEKIRTGAMTMAQGAVELGYQLKIARDTGVLQESGYSSMGEFAREEYGLRPDQTTRYIQLNDKYSENGYSRRLQEKYTGIGKTILMEMLTLPDIISEEITESFSKEDVRTLNSEIKEENMITDLEVMMEETDQKQEELPSILEKTAYQLGKDHPETYIELFEAFEIDDSQGAAEILAPNEEKIYSLRIPGIGRMLLSLKLSEQEIRLINVRSQEKEDFIWQQLERALRNLMDFTKNAKESWEKQYGEKLPEKEHLEDKPEKKPARVQKAKKPEKKKPDQVEKVDNSVDKSQETAVEEKEELRTESTVKYSFCIFCNLTAGKAVVIVLSVRNSMLFHSLFIGWETTFLYYTNLILCQHGDFLMSQLNQIIHGFFYCLCMICCHIIVIIVIFDFSHTYIWNFILLEFLEISIPRCQGKYQEAIHQ